MTHAAEPFSPEIGQAAFGAPWQEYAMPDFVRGGLAELGEAVRAESSTGGDPTDNSGASFANDVFALRAYCYSADTRVMTGRGWQHFPNLQKEDRFLSLNPETFGLEWVKAVHFIDLPYDGFLKRIHGNSLDLLITPDHRMFVLDYDKRPKFCSLSDVRSGDYITARCDWRGFDAEVNFGGYRFSAEQFARFMGWYLSEGSAVRRGPNWVQCSIGQSNEIQRQQIFEDLESMGLPVSKGSYQVWIRDSQLGAALLAFGGSRDKWVPVEIKNASRRTILAFLDTYLEGDGSRTRPSGWGTRQREVIYTSSELMVSDLCELILKTGRHPSIGLIRARGTRQTIKGSIYPTNANVYSIGIGYGLETRIGNAKIEETAYSGRVYDVSLEKNHTLLIERRGKVWWGSNCWCDGENTDHAEGCPPNFEHHASGFAASWYKYLGRGSSISDPITEHDFEQLLADCRASLPGSGVSAAREQLNKAAAAVLPTDAFVESSIEGDQAWLRAWLPWPAHIAAAPDPDPTASVAPSVASAEGGLRVALAQIGWIMASDETEFHLTAPFPPLGDDDPQDAEASKYYRQLSDDELRAAGWDDPSEAFVSDRFVLVAHSGINLFRSARRAQAEVHGA